MLSAIYIKLFMEIIAENGRNIICSKNFFFEEKLSSS